MSEPSPIILSAPDAGNRGAGEALRLAREAQGLTLEGLAAMIKVTPAKLEALEQGQYDRLPDPSFTRALAMTVCRALKLEPSAILASLPAAKPVSLAAGKPPLNQPFKEARGGAPLFDKHLDWTTFLRLKWLGPLGILLAALLVYLLPESFDLSSLKSRLNQPAAQAASAPASGDTVASSAADASTLPEPAGSDAAALAAAATPASAASQGMVSLTLDSADAASAPAMAASASQAAALSERDPRLAVAVSPDGSSVGLSDLVIDAEASSWVEIRDANGAKLLSRNVQSGERVSVDGVAPLKVRIGNASGMAVRFRGQPVDLSVYTRNNVAKLELK